MRRLIYEVADAICTWTPREISKGQICSALQGREQKFPIKKISRMIPEPLAKLTNENVGRNCSSPSNISIVLPQDVSLRTGKYYRLIIIAINNKIYFFFQRIKTAAQFGGATILAIRSRSSGQEIRCGLNANCSKSGGSLGWHDPRPR